MAATFLEEQFSLVGETAVVVGGTGELCGAIAEGLARAGAKVALVVRDEKKAAAHLKAIQKSGGQAIFLPAEATKKADLARVLAGTEKAFGPVTIAVNGAGVNSATPFLDVTDEELQRIFDVNYKSVHFGCQVFGKAMIDAKKGGCILNISSMAAVRPLSRVFNYSASKAAMLNLTLNLAREWAPHHVRVNALAPGFFPAEQNRKVLTPDRVENIMRMTPMKRFGEAHELVGAAVFLCARKAGSFVTGCHLTVDGGFSVTAI